MDAVAPEPDQARGGTLAHTPNPSPSKQTDGDPAASAPATSKKQQSTPPIKDIRANSL